MMWRQSQKARIFEGFSMPDLVFCSLDGQSVNISECRMVTLGWGPESLADQEVWRRLAVGDFGEGGWKKSLILPAFSKAKSQMVQEILPPSSHGDFAFCLDAGDELRSLLEPDLPSRAAAWCPQKQLMIIGPSTEESWDAMFDALTSLAG